MLLRSLAFFGAAGVVVVACGADAEGDALRTSLDPSCGGQVRPAILDGYADVSCGDTSAVVRVDGDRCTGSLIAPDLVLTAAHCIAAVSKATPKCIEVPPVWLEETRAVGSVTVERGTEGEPGHATVEIAVKEVKRADDDSLCGADLALLVLSAPVPSDVARPLPLRLSRPVQPGERVEAIGYGKRENGKSGRRDRTAPIPVERVGPALPVCGHPALAPHEFETGRSFCQGDSGGPAIAAETGEIVGVVARNLDDGCVSDKGYVYTELAGHQTFLARVLAEHATKKPKVGAMSLAFGGVCADGDGCDSGLCVLDADRAYCSRTCDTMGDAKGYHPCPGGWACAATGTAKVCVPENATNALARKVSRARVDDIPTERGGCGADRAPACESDAGLWALAILALACRRGLRDAARLRGGAGAPSAPATRRPPSR